MRFVGPPELLTLNFEPMLVFNDWNGAQRSNGWNGLNNHWRQWWGDVPDVTGHKMAVGARHRFFLARPFNAKIFALSFLATLFTQTQLAIKRLPLVDPGVWTASQQDGDDGCDCGRAWVD
jgi:hypothetical protein